MTMIYKLKETPRTFCEADIFLQIENHYVLEEVTQTCAWTMAPFSVHSITNRVVIAYIRSASDYTTHSSGLRLFTHMHNYYSLFPQHDTGCVCVGGVV